MQKQILAGLSLILALTVIFQIAFAGSPTVQQPSAAAKWEYKILGNRGAMISENELNQLGSDGWEFVSSMPDNPTSDRRQLMNYVFKRPAKP